MENLEHESSQKEEISSSLGHGGSNSDSTNAANPGQENFKSHGNPLNRYVDSLKEAMVLLKKYEQETTAKCYKSDKLF